MIFILDNEVIYDSLNGSLRRTDQKMADAQMLTTIANKILSHLVIHHGELVSRNTLFDEVWEKAGLVSSSNTLNQYISVLRKMFSGYLGEKEVIITVPRAGYMLSKEVSISEYTPLQRHLSLWPKFVAGVIGLCVFIAGTLMFASSPEKIVPRKIGELKGCPVYDISGVKSDVGDATNYNVSRQALEMNNQICTETTAFYVYAQETLHLHKPARIMFTRCIEWNDSRDTCQNIYYYSWIR
ncbi:winged helix-turn-helix domain-containing protein [Cronobacter dublinensis]|uniref:winged helix-turn-helix domain-containing protein n=1 Tax=Cronobacter dublinensis TaxID=413497 RepID=UPI00300DDD0F